MRYLKYIGYILILLFIISGCNSEKKAVRYKYLYDEKPVVVMVAKPFDLSKRKGEKERDAGLYNLELKNTGIFFHNSLQYQLTRKGYYTIPYFASEKLIQNETGNAHAFIPYEAPLNVFSVKFGIDAILYTTIYKWKDYEEEWDVYIDYQLRSTKTGRILFQTKCKGRKYISINRKGLVVVQKFDKNRVKILPYDDRTLNRMILLQKMNEYIMKNIPNGQSHKKFEADINKAAHPKYIEFWVDELGSIHIKPILLEQFEQECFLEN